MREHIAARRALVAQDAVEQQVVGRLGNGAGAVVVGAVPAPGRPKFQVLEIKRGSLAPVHQAR